MYYFVGESRHTIDAKNRLFIPAKYREELGVSFYITRKLTVECIGVYSEAQWEVFSQKINSLPDSVVGKIKRFVFSKSALVSHDPHGRILVPPSLLSYAHIDKNAVVAGIGDHLQIWAEDIWDEQQAKDSQSSDISDLARELGL
ncbi:MAG: division/cell wall cluster transcriptional repressor MraZ [Clostridia bacterium]|nr:division/cell wall cluster transcriptional repressor MraZ [Clostridia bacterium]